MRILFLIFISFLIAQCSNEVPTQDDSLNSKSAKVSLKFDKDSLPSDAISVKVFLTQKGQDTLQIISTLHDDILFEDLIPGEGSLQVYINNSAGSILYFGEADILILSRTHTKVNLTLIPSNNQVGRISMNIQWEEGISWLDYPDNPILTQSFLPEIPLAVYRPKILLEDGINKMWFTGLYNSANANIWYAESDNGINNWQLKSDSPVLTPGIYPSWDSYSVMSGPVIKDRDEFKMYYLGFTEEKGIWNIGLATSMDGIHWIKYPDPVIVAGVDEYEIIPGDIIKINGTFFLYYSVKQYPYYEIRLAVSLDGINFTKAENNPVLIPDQRWEGSGIYSPSVIYDNNQFKMIYADINQYISGLGMAYSKDGIHWIKNPDNPFFTIEKVNNKWCKRIIYPYWRKFNNQYRIYYTANVEGFYASQIGMIYK